MGIKGQLAAVGTMALLASSLWAVPAGAATASTDLEFCQQARDSGLLEKDGTTFGECVNISRGPSEPANNYFAGICGFDEALVFTNTSNKGQCIQVAKNLPQE